MKVSRKLAAGVAMLSVCAVTTVAASPAQARVSTVLTTTGAEGHLLGLSGAGAARLTSATTGAGIAGRQVRITSGAFNQPYCVLVTDQEGWGSCTAAFGLNLFKVVGALAGYDAFFDGDSTYAPSTAHGSISINP